MQLVTFLLHSLACSSSDLIQVSIKNSDEIPSIIQITTSSTELGTFWISGESGHQIWKTTIQEAQKEAHFTLLGLEPNTTHQCTIHFKNESGEIFEKNTEIVIPSLGSISSSIPLSIEEEQISDGYFFGTIFGETIYLILINTEGTILWGVEQGDYEHGGIDSDVSSDRSLIYFNQFNKDKAVDDSKLFKMNWLGELLEEIPTPFAHHMFDVLPDDSIVYISLDQRSTPEYGNVCGDKIVQRFSDGSEDILFSTWDHMTVYESASWNFTLYPFCSDWTHGNFLEWNPERASYLFSMAGTDTIFELSEAGEPIQVFTGLGAFGLSSALQPVTGGFSYPHGPHWNQAGELMFISTVEEQSRAIAYQINDDHTLEKTWVWGDEYNYRAYNLGEVIEVKDNHRFVNWGSVGVMQIIDENDSVLWEVHSGLNQWFAQFEYWDSLPGMEYVNLKDN